MSDPSSQPPPQPTAPPPPPGTPGGYAPPPTGAPAPAAASSGGGVSITGTAWWSVVAVACLAVAVSVNEDGDNGWGRVGVWAGVAIAAAVATLVPSIRQQLKLSAETAWQVATVGGIALAGYWVLFVLPWIEQNVSFLATVGCAAGIYAAWRAPGRPAGPNQQAF